MDLGWKPFVKTWIQKLPRDMPDSGKRYLQSMFDYSIEKGFKFFQNHKRFQCVPAPDMSIISCLCHILSAFFDFMSKHGGFGNPGWYRILFHYLCVCVFRHSIVQ